ncbi:MAG: tol-pal system YbgF family protein [Polyangiales bacterium]
MTGEDIRQPTWSFLIAGALLVMSAAAPHSVRAQDSAEESVTQNDAENSAESINEEARGLFEAGAAAFSDGRFQDALTYWQGSYGLSHRPELLHNIGIAHDRLGQRDEAIAKYRAYLEQRPEAENRAYVERRISQLVEQAAENQSAGEASLNIPALVLSGVGGAMLISGLGTGLATNGRFSDLEAACPESVCEEAERGNAEQVRRLARTTDVLLIVGGAATVAGLVWWFVGGRSEPAVQVGVTPTGLDVRGRF